MSRGARRILVKRIHVPDEEACVLAVEALMERAGTGFHPSTAVDGRNTEQSSPVVRRGQESPGRPSPTRPAGKTSR